MYGACVTIQAQVKCLASNELEAIEQNLASNMLEVVAIAQCTDVISCTCTNASLCWIVLCKDCMHGFPSMYTC